MALRFQDLEPSLLPETLKAIDTFAFDRMTPVQNAAIPLFLQNKDVCVEVSWARDTGDRRVVAQGLGALPQRYASRPPPWLGSGVSCHTL